MYIVIKEGRQDNTIFKKLLNAQNFAMKKSNKNGGVWVIYKLERICGVYSERWGLPQKKVIK